IEKITRGHVGSDGHTVSIDVEFQSGKRQALVFPYDELDLFVQVLLSLTSSAVDKQAETERVSRITAVDPAMAVESFRVLPNSSTQRAIVQLVGRPVPNGPLGMGSCLIDAGLAKALGERLLVVAEELSKPQIK